MNTIPVRRHCIGVVKASGMTSHIQQGIEPSKLKSCPGWAHGNSDYCFLHDPSISKQQRREIAVKGGHAGRGRRRFNLRTPKGIQRCSTLALNSIFNQLWEPGDPTLELKLIRALTGLIRASFATIHLQGRLDRARRA